MRNKGETQSAPPRTPVSHSLAHDHPRPGLRLGRYELVCRIARGGMAEVWVGRQRGELGFSRIVAVKTILPELADDPSFRRMFLDEARIAARIRHTNVVEVLDLGEAGSIVFQAMAFIEGDSVAGLLKRLERRRRAPGLPPAIASRIIADAATGLHAAHELVDEHGAAMHLVHRDVSPHNILVGSDGVAKLSDFGIAKVLGRHTEETIGQVKGKFAYLAPEQAARRPLDRRADVFSAGVVLWEALTGERLLRGDDDIETLANVVKKTIPDPRSVDATIPPPIAEVTMRALRRERDDRFPTAAAMAEALEEAVRWSGLVASPKEVAAFVSELAGEAIEEQRSTVRRALRGDIPPPTVDLAAIDESDTTSLATTAVRQARKGPSGAVRLVGLVIGAGAIVAAAAALRAGARAHTPSDASVTAAEAAATTSVLAPDLARAPQKTAAEPAASETTAAVIEPTPATTTTVRAAETSAAALGSARTAPRAPSGARPSAKQAPAHRTDPGADHDAPRAKFDNPYQQ